MPFKKRIDGVGKSSKLRNGEPLDRTKQTLRQQGQSGIGGADIAQQHVFRRGTHRCPLRWYFLVAPGPEPGLYPGRQRTRAEQTKFRTRIGRRCSGYEQLPANDAIADAAAAYNAGPTRVSTGSRGGGLC